MKKYFIIIGIWFLTLILILFGVVVACSKTHLDISNIKGGFWFAIVTIPLTIFLVWIYFNRNIKPHIKNPPFIFIIFGILIYLFAAILAFPEDNKISRTLFYNSKWIFLGGQIILGFSIYYFFTEKKLIKYAATPNTIVTQQPLKTELVNLEKQLLLLLKRQGYFQLERLKGGLSVDQQFRLDDDLLLLEQEITAIRNRISEINEDLKNGSE